MSRGAHTTTLSFLAAGVGNANPERGNLASLWLMNGRALTEVAEEFLGGEDKLLH